MKKHIFYVILSMVWFLTTNVLSQSLLGATEDEPGGSLQITELGGFLACREPGVSGNSVLPVISARQASPTAR